MRYKILSGDHEVQITELGFTKQLEIENDAIIIYDDDISSANTILKIIIDDYLTIYYYIEVFRTGLQDFTVFIIPETQTALLGGKRKSCSVDIVDQKVENVFEHCLFWDFSLLDNGYIYESGELDCLLRDKSGKIVDRVPVDPPWESSIEDDGIRLSSICYGITFLKFPVTDC